MDRPIDRHGNDLNIVDRYLIYLLNQKSNLSRNSKGYVPAVEREFQGFDFVSHSHFEYFKDLRLKTKIRMPLDVSDHRSAETQDKPKIYREKLQLPPIERYSRPVKPVENDRPMRFYSRKFQAKLPGNIN